MAKAPASQSARRILEQKDLELWLQSETKRDVLCFIKELNESVVDAPNSTKVVRSLSLDGILSILDRVSNIVTDHPATDNEKSRFGNPAFQAFYDDLFSNAAELHAIFDVAEEHRQDLITYFCEAWGNRTRIDYGSGHELNFLCWLLCLRKLEILTTSDDQALVLRIFTKYITIMRQIQSMYWLEPAGSHGVWGLDDYHFLPFMFGSAQLKDHKYLRPKSIHDSDVLETYGDNYMYLACIRFVNAVKTASLRWHSPMLDDISAAKSWGKINEGMIKMYDAEVLGKLPIMQHFKFTSLLPADASMSEVGKAEQYPHTHNSWGDCCGIKVPSAIAAKSLQKQTQHLRPLPFD